MIAQLTSNTTTVQDLESPSLPNQRSYCGRLYEKLHSGGTICRCFQKAKEYFSAIYGRPYPSLSKREVIGNYCMGSMCCAWGLVWAGLATYLMIASINNDSPPKDDLPLSVVIPILSFVDFVGLLSIGAGLTTFYKTYKAPRQEENQALLS